MKHSGKTNWERLKRMDDTEIDYTDIPKTDMNFWDDAQVLLLHKKVEIKLEIDEDIATWLKQFGDNSSNAVNNLLRSYFIGIKKFPYLRK